MAKQKVSSDFAKWQEKTANKLSESKKAENNSTGIPLPVGATGLCTVIDLTFGTTKKNNHPYASIKCVTTEGKKFTKMYLFNGTEKATGADRWSWMLNEFENSGMPRAFREEKGDDANALIDYFLAGEAPIQMSYEVVADSYGMNGKRVNFGLPDGIQAVEASQQMEFCKSVEELAPEKFLLWNDTPQKILKIEDSKVTVKSTTTNAQRTLEIADLTF